MSAETALLPPDTELWIADEELPLTHGGSIAPLRIGYELTGPEGAPVVAVLGGISAHRHIFSSAANRTPGWWEALAGATDGFRVLGIDYLGGSGISSKGTIIAPADQARALELLLDRLGLQSFAAIIGCSYGGMVALEFAARAPARVRHIVVVAAAHESHPMATAWRTLQRRIVAFGLERGAGAEALAIARALGITTYRSPAEFAERFTGQAEWRDGRPRFPVEPYLEAHGERFAREFDPSAFLCLSQSIDLHRIRPEEVTTPATIIAFDSDQLVPIAQARELAARLAGPARLVTIPSRYGHDGFLKETERMNIELRKALERRPQ